MMPERSRQSEVGIAVVEDNNVIYTFFRRNSQSFQTFSKLATYIQFAKSGKR